VTTALRPEVFAPPQRPQIAPRRIADQHHVAAVPAIAAVGPALRHVRFASKGDAAVAARTALYPDSCRVVHGTKIDGSRPRTGSSEDPARDRPATLDVTSPCVAQRWCFFLPLAGTTMTLVAVDPVVAPLTMTGNS